MHMHPTQHNAILAREYLADLRATVNTALEALPFPDDYATNDDAALAYELATEAVQAHHGLRDAERLSREADDALITWALDVARATDARAFAPIASIIERARASSTHRERLIALALRLRA